MRKNLQNQLKQTCQLTGAQWAVWLCQMGEEWDIHSPVKLSQLQKSTLLGFVRNNEVNTWVTGALKSGRTRSRTMDPSTAFGCSRVHFFPNTVEQGGILVGSQVPLSSQAKSFFRVLARQDPAHLIKHGAPLYKGSLADSTKTSGEAPFDSQSMLAELASAVGEGMDLGEITRSIIQRLRRTFRSEHVAIFLLEKDQGTLREYDADVGAEARRILLKDSLAGLAMEEGHPVRVGDISQIPRYHGPLNGERSVLVVPLKYRSRVNGAIMVRSRKRDAFTLQDEQLLQAVASYLAGLLENARLWEESQEWISNLKLIHQVVEQLVGMTDAGGIVQVAARLIAEYFHYEFVVISLVDPSKRYLIGTGIGGTMAERLEPGFRFPVSRGVTGFVYRTGKSVFLNDTSQNKHYVPLPDWSAGAQICVPLRNGQEVVGVINLEREHKGSFCEDDLLMFESLAGILTSVILSARRYQELGVSVRQLRAVRETALDISGDLGSHTLFNRIVRRARELVNARGAGLVFVDQEKRRVELVVDETPWYKFSPFSYSSEEGIAGRVIASGKTVIVTDYQHWPDRVGAPLEPPITLVAGVPLKLKGEVIGILMIMDDTPGRHFSDEETKLLELLAPQITVSLQNASLYRELEERMVAQKKAERGILRSARLAAVGEMAAGVAHELNNPLTTISGFVELALDELPKDLPQRSELEIVMREANRAREVVRRMLDFARPGENARIPTDLNSLVAEVISFIQYPAQQSGIQVEMDFASHLPLIQADPNQIKQVLLNLLQNSQQAMPKGGSLRLSTAQGIHDGRLGVKFKVEDTGHGISRDNLDRIFDPFFTTRPPGSGTGLGLSVSYSIISEHHGYIDVDSQVGVGTCFTVWLPVGEE